MDLDCHLGLGVLGSLILSWGLGPGLRLRRPLLGRGTLFPRHNETDWRCGLYKIWIGNLPLFFPAFEHVQTFFFRLTRGWTWLAVLRQCFSSGTAADGHTPYKARPNQN